MAVSGRKILDCEGSRFLGSADDFKHICVPCLSDDKHVEARGFCVECQEYLCKTCLHCHRKIKASKHHELLEIDEMFKPVTSRKSSGICTEKCSIHRNKTIKFFCHGHEKLGCSDCMTMKHRTCDLEYIPDKGAGTEGNEEYTHFLETLELMLTKADNVMKKAEDKNKDLDAWYDEIIEDVDKFRKEINDHLDNIQKRIEVEAKNDISTHKQEVDNIFESCTNFTSDIKTLQCSLMDLKLANKNGDLFIAIKRAKSKLQVEEMLRAEIVLEEMTRLLFERNRVLENILSVETFGNLTENSSEAKTSDMITSHTKLMHAPERKQMFSKLSYKGDINVRLATDFLPCYITGCRVLSSDRIILADNKNRKLKVVNTLTAKVVEEKQLNSYPFDVEVLPKSQIAVTMPDNGEILIMKTDGQLSVSRSIKIQRRCRGITYHEDRLYVVCAEPNCVLTLDSKGNIKSILPLEDETVFNSPYYIALNKENKQLYISDLISTAVVSLTLQGEMSAGNMSISGPMGLMILDDSSLLVCRYYDNIYRLQTDLQQSYVIASDLGEPKALCYNSDKNEVYVGGFFDELKLYRLQ